MDPEYELKTGLTGMRYIVHNMYDPMSYTIHSMLLKEHIVTEDMLRAREKGAFNHIVR